MKFPFLVSLSFLFSAHSIALASCGAASCPLNSYRFLTSGSLHLSYVYEYINQDQIYVGSTKAFVGAIPQHHDEVQTLNSRNIIQLHYGLSDQLSLGIDMPFVHREHSHIHHDQGEDVWESWNFSGLGDLWMGGQFSLLVPESDFAPHLSIMAGVKLPTGITDARNAEGEEAEVALQPGSGSTDGIIGLSYRQTIFSVHTLSGEYSALPLIGAVTYQFNGNGTNDWRFGNTLIASAGTAYQFTKQASLLLQVNGRFQEFADTGTTGEPRENTGGTWVFVSPGVAIQLNDAFSAYSYVQLPLYQDVHGIQQTAGLNLLFGMSATVDLLE